MKFAFGKKNVSESESVPVWADVIYGESGRDIMTARRDGIIDWVARNPVEARTCTIAYGESVFLNNSPVKISLREYLGYPPAGE